MRKRIDRPGQIARLPEWTQEFEWFSRGWFVSPEQ